MTKLIPIPELVEEIRKSIRCVDALTAKTEAEHKDAIIIDVREPSEALDNPTPNTINIPRGILEMKMTTLYPSPDQAIYIHCATGARATLAAEQLKRIGYEEVNIITCDIETIRST